SITEQVDEATIYFKNGALELARQTLEAAIERNPNESVAHGNLGVILGTAGDFDGEIKEESRAIELDPNSASAYLNLGWAQARKGAWKKSLEAYKKAHTLDTTMVEAKVGQALAEARLGSASTARATLEKAKAEHPDAAWPHIGLSNVLAEQGKLTEA